MERVSGAEEAILLASDPRDVRDYLAQRAKMARFVDAVSKEAEADLLLRSDRLIDLSLAEFCLHPETARCLFDRDAYDWPVRALILSNTALAKSSFRAFPECLFGSDDAVLEYLGQAKADELAVLFRNPSLDESFLEAFLSLGEPWTAIPADRRFIALDYLGQNEKLRRKRFTADHDDGWDWYMAGKPFEAAWSLIGKLEPSSEAATHLSRLLRDLPADSYRTEGLLEAIIRWRDDQASIDVIKKENSRARLSHFQQVRQAGARLLAGRHYAKPGELLDSDDVALRCGAYEGAGKLTIEQIKAAVDRDSDLGRVYLLRNEALWRNEKTRDLLNDQVLRGAETDEPRWEYQAREAHYRKHYPSWFDDTDRANLLDELRVSESSVAELVRGVTGDPLIKGLHTRLASLEKSQQTLFWLVAAVLVLKLVEAWPN